AERNDRGDDLVLGQNGGEATDREIKHPQQQKHQIRTEICSGGMSGRLMRYLGKDREVEQRRDPENEVKDQRAKKFREHHLPVAHRGGHEWLDRAELKFFGEQAHRNERKNQDEGEPEEDRVKERLLRRVLHWALVHEGNLKIKIDPTDDQEKDENDVGNGRVKVAAYFA